MSQDETWLLQEKYAGVETEAFFHDVERLKKGEPLAYVIGAIPFLHTNILLGSRPLIPRVETEFWVEKIIAQIQHNAVEEVRVLDLCAGSGCIGIAILKDIPKATVDFAEIDVNHHETINTNLRENNLTDRTTEIFGGNLFEQVTKKYDYILSNPPYIDASLKRTDENVRTYEPDIALYGGIHGMELIEHILEEAPAFLTEEGILVFEHEPEQTRVVVEHATKCGFTCHTYTDQFDVERFTVCSRASTPLVSQ